MSCARSNLVHRDPGVLWGCYIQLIEVEQVSKDLKQDLAVRADYHVADNRMDAITRSGSGCRDGSLVHEARGDIHNLLNDEIGERIETKTRRKALGFRC